MTISEELREYILHYEMACGHKPSAMPVTHEEARMLFAEWKEFLMVPIEDGVPQFLGVDLYEIPNAKGVRDSVTAK